jgi:hypothetical protein
LLVAEVQLLEASAYSDFARTRDDVERLASDLEL